MVRRGGRLLVVGVGVLLGCCCGLRVRWSLVGLQDGPLGHAPGAWV